MKNKNHLSFSQINMFLRCPKQYEYRYMEGLRIPPAGAMVMGKAWHRTLERNYKQKIESHEDRPLGEMKEYFAYCFDGETSSQDVVYDEGEGPGELKDMGILVTIAHHERIAPAVQPATVEEKFEVSLGEGFPYDLVGIFDLIDAAGIVIDNKSYARTPSQEDVNKDLQLSTYALGYRIKNARSETGLRMDAVIKTKKPKAVQLKTERTNDECRWLLGLIEKVAAAIEAGIFYPNPTGWHCSEKMCGYWTRCKERSKR